MHICFTSHIFAISLHKLAAFGLIHGILHLWILFLQLQEETWVFDLDQVIHVLQSGLHECNLGFDAIVSESNALANGVLRARHKVTGEQLNKFVLDVLNKV